MSDQKQAQPMMPAKPELTRVPVKHLFFQSNEHADLPGGNGQVSNVKCYREPAQASRWFTCEFIPAWQTFELSYHLLGSAEPEVINIPASTVKKWTRG